MEGERDRVAVYRTIDDRVLIELPPEFRANGNEIMADSLDATVELAESLRLFVEAAKGASVDRI